MKILNVSFSILAILFFLSCAENVSHEKGMLTDDDYDAVAVMVGAELSSANDGDFSIICSMLDYKKPMKNALGKITSDTSFTKNGFNITFYRKYFNSTGDSTDTYLPGTTVGMFTKRSISGNRTTPNHYMERNHSTKMTVTGIDTISTAITLNGSDQKYMLHEMNGMMGKSGMRTFAMNGSGTTEAVTINKNDGDQYPESGKKTMTMTVEKVMSKNDKTKTMSSVMDIEIIFNGTVNPEITINKTKTYTGNLNTGHVVKK